MVVTLPAKWTSFKIAFFYKRLHEENGQAGFPKNPKFYIAGKHFEDHQTLCSHITEVEFYPKTMFNNARLPKCQAK